MCFCLSHAKDQKESSSLFYKCFSLSLLDPVHWCQARYFTPLVFSIVAVIEQSYNIILK